MNRILYKDKYCAVVQKRAGELCENHSTDKNAVLLCTHVAQELSPDSFTDTGARGQKPHGQKPFMECVNRLDMPVSGATLVAFSKEAFTKFTNLFSNDARASKAKAVSKTYWAIVEKPRDASLVPPLYTDITLTHRIMFNRARKKAYIRPMNDGTPHGTQNDAPHDAALSCALDTTAHALSCVLDTSAPHKNRAPDALCLPQERANNAPHKNGSNGVGIKGGKDASWKEASLTYRVIGEGERYLFLCIDLHTGRTHQIRAQLSFCGLPIKGDVKYGARRKDTLNGIRLHARTLSFVHPYTGERVHVDSPLVATDALWDAFCAFERDARE